jgi:uncharacterized protein (TIGR02466 family)
MPSFFSTEIYHKPLGGTGLAKLCRELHLESEQIRQYDREGTQWSEKHYRGGYTSFSSMAELHEFSSTFRALSKRIDLAMRSYVRRLGLAVDPRTLRMTDCWVNMMPAGVHHSMHIHPHSVISGTFYVATPKNAPGIRFEDPRLASFMARPLVAGAAPASRQTHIELPTRSGDLVLFESWLRHEVPARDYVGERVSISFNYA